MDYRMLRVDDLSDFDLETRNQPCTTNPPDVKGDGETGAIDAPPAFIGALVNAVSAEAGIVRLDMPAPPQSVGFPLNAAVRDA